VLLRRFLAALASSREGVRSVVTVIIIGSRLRGSRSLCGFEGHVSGKPPESTAHNSEQWQVAYAARRVRASKSLASLIGIPGGRTRISVNQSSGSSMALCPVGSAALIPLTSQPASRIAHDVRRFSIGSPVL